MWAMQREGETDNGRRMDRGGRPGWAAQVCAP